MSKIQIRTGEYLDILDPDPAMITIENIAHNLSHICRFTGNVDTFYSVAQHSVLVSREVSQEFELEALLHDATEAFIGDVSTPLKSLLPEYKRIEDNLHRIIAKKFNLPEHLSPEVKVADRFLCEQEKLSLLPSTAQCQKYWGNIKLSKKISPYASPIMSYNSFMDRFKELTK
jgi:5'-deoxynucleotidase YfbR-like HD superfamily hydrolase